MVTEGWERRNFGFCKINSALFWQQIIHKWAARQQPVPSLLPCLLLSLLPSLFPFLRNRKNQTNGFVVRFFEEGTNPDGNKYLLFIKDIYRNGYIGERDVCSLVPISCSHSAWKQHELSARPTCRAAPENAADPVPPPPIPLGQGAGGSKGARPPSPEVQEPGGSW